jgi:hypothetical protein
MARHQDSATLFAQDRAAAAQDKVSISISSKGSKEAKAVKPEKGEGEGKDALPPAFMKKKGAVAAKGGMVGKKPAFLASKPK